MKPTRLAVAALAVAATGLLGVCTSQPSAKAVAKDVVQSITVPGTGQRLPEAQQECMLDVIDKMSTDQIQKLGADNLDATINSSGGGDAEMQAFIDELQRCQPSSSSSSTTKATPSTPSTPSTPATGATSGSSTTTTLG